MVASPWQASESDHIDIVRLLFVHNDNVDAGPDVEGNTAILPASEYDHVEIIRLLLISGCKDPNLRNNGGNTPLMKLSCGGYTEVVNLLLLELEAFALTKKNKNEETALIVASMKGHAGSVRLLLKHGHVDIALLLASALGQSEVIKPLLEHKSIANRGMLESGGLNLPPPTYTISPSKSNPFMSQTAGLQLIPVSNECKSLLKVVMGWQEAKIPFVLAMCNGNLRKLAKCVRQQHVNFMIITHQSLTAADAGQGLSRQGLKVLKVLLGEDNSFAGAQEEFTKTSIQEIQESGSELQKCIADMRNKFRDLRVAMIALHTGSEDATKQKRMELFARIFSKDAKICEEMLKKVVGDLVKIEESLNAIICWWQKVHSELNHLRMNGKSSMMRTQNPILLEGIKTNFMKLDNYFGDYLDTMTKVYDENLTKLNTNDRRYLDKFQDHPDLVVSRVGRLEPGRK